MNGTHISVDIEACGEILISLGACAFNPSTGVAYDDFYCVPSWEDQSDKGLSFDAGAFRWWLNQSDAARAAVTSGQEPAAVALSRWHSWMARHPNAWVWAYPTSFDLPVIAKVCGTFGVRPPWQWTKTLDGRTLWRLACAVNPELANVEKTANPSPHHALEDAKEQARWFAQYLRPILSKVPSEI